MKNKILLLCIAVLFCGCANTPKLSKDNTYSEHYAGVGKDKRIFIVPVRENFSQLEGGGKKVLGEIGEQLQQEGWGVATMSQENFLDIWSGIVRSMGGIYSRTNGQVIEGKYQYALEELVKTINKNEKYAATIIPSFVLKTAELNGRHAKWDGVKRLKLADPPYSSGMSWSGTTKGLSLKLMTFDSSGKWMFTSYGGLVLPFHTVVKDGKASNQPRENIFDADEDIESGVRVALLPILDKDMVNKKAGEQ